MIPALVHLVYSFFPFWRPCHLSILQLFEFLNLVLYLSSYLDRRIPHHVGVSLSWVPCVTPYPVTLLTLPSTRVLELFFLLVVVRLLGHFPQRGINSFLAPCWGPSSSYHVRCFLVIFGVLGSSYSTIFLASPYSGLGWVPSTNYSCLFNFPKTLSS